MSETTIQPDDMRGAAEEFNTAEKELAAVLKRLDTATGTLKGKWEGTSQQSFYKEYENLRKYMEAFGVLLTHISSEMIAMAERFEDADK